MTTIIHHNNAAFILDGRKVKDFSTRKVMTSSDALKRFESHKPGKGIVTPFKR